MLIGLEEIAATTIAQLFARYHVKTEQNNLFGRETRTTSDLSIIEPRQLENKPSGARSLGEKTETDRDWDQDH